MSVTTKLSLTEWSRRLFLGVLLAVLGVAGWGWGQLQNIDHEVRNHRVEQARHELQSNIVTVQNRALQSLQKLASWNETRQQIYDPGYYHYWLADRLAQPDVTTLSRRTIQLYDRKGYALDGGLPGLPSALPSGPPNVLLALPGRDERHIFIYTTVLDSSAKPIGYVGGEVDLPHELGSLNGLSYADPNSLHLIPSTRGVLAGEALLNGFRYQVTPDSNWQTLHQQILNTYLGLALVVLSGFLVQFLFIHHKLASPLRRLAERIYRLNTGSGELQAVQELFKPMPLTELEVVRQALQGFRHRLSEVYQSLESRNAAFRDQARRDAMTGVLNRRAFEEDWEALFQQAGDGRPVAVALLLFDCDHFKAINDTYGHATGDQVLKAICFVLGQIMRSADHLYRLGGDEFATLVPHADEGQAMRLAQRCQRALEGHDFHQYALKEPVTISIGVAVDEVARAEDLTRLQARADTAMYRAKRPGSPRVHVHGKSEALDSTLVASPEVSALYRALADPTHFHFLYQPLVLLPCGRAEYHEILTRVQLGQGIMGPDRFLEIVHNRRLEKDLDLAVLTRLRHSLQAGLIPPGSGLAVNLFAQSLACSDILAILQDMAASHPANPFLLEITENALNQEGAELAAPMHALRDAGFRLALDDFGKAYSPLGYLAELPVQYLKFDPALTRQLHRDDMRGRMATRFAQLMHDAGYHLMAEGVESAQQLARVRDLGFGHAQGYFLGRPASALLPQTAAASGSMLAGAPDGENDPDAVEKGHQEAQ